MDASPVGGRDGRDPDGRLRLADGELLDVHGWTAQRWAESGLEGVGWAGEHANWSRFINHASGDAQNVAVASTPARFGKSHALYAKRVIAAGEELYLSYGVNYWKARGVQPGLPQA